MPTYTPSRTSLLARDALSYTHSPANTYTQASNWAVRYNMSGKGWFELPLEIGSPEWRDGQLLIELLHGQVQKSPFYASQLIRCCLMTARRRRARAPACTQLTPPLSSSRVLLLLQRRQPLPELRRRQGWMSQCRRFQGCRCVGVATTVQIVA